MIAENIIYSFNPDEYYSHIMEGIFDHWLNGNAVEK